MFNASKETIEFIYRIWNDSGKLQQFRFGLLGMGKSNRSCQAWLHSLGAYTETWDDRDSNNPPVQNLAQEWLGKIDVLVKSPGVARDHSVLKAWSGPIVNDVQLALAIDPRPVLAVTGSNGKSTFVSQLHFLMEKLNIPAFLGGNIGTPVCECFSDINSKYLVLELSSYQLEDLHRYRGVVAVILNIHKHHMERYQSIEEYAQAKHKIFETSVFGEDENQEEESFLKIKSQDVESSLKAILNSLSDRESFDLDLEKIPDMMRSFQGLPHRIERFESRGVRFVNDSKSTNLMATLYACDYLKNDELVLLMGGKLKIEELEKYNPSQFPENVAQVIYFGEAGQKLFEMYQGDSRVHRAFVSLKECLVWIRENKKHDSQDPKTILLSPGFASFDEFSSFEERGDYFKTTLK